jgi:hypothetical protein
MPEKFISLAFLWQGPYPDSPFGGRGSGDILNKEEEGAKHCFFFDLIHEFS